MSKRTGELERYAATAEVIKQNAVLDAQNKCAETLGANRVLGQQNRDQQNTINNCQTHALALLVPAPRKLSFVTISDEIKANNERKHIYVLLTNKLISPIRAYVECDQPITSSYAEVAANSGTMGGTYSQEGKPNALLININSAISQDLPLILTVGYSGPKHIKCGIDVP